MVSWSNTGEGQKINGTIHMLKTLQVQILPVSPIIHFHLILFPQDSCRKLTKDIITQLYFIYTKGLNLIQGGSFPSGGLFSWITKTGLKYIKKDLQLCENIQRPLSYFCPLYTISVQGILESSL